MAGESIRSMLSPGTLDQLDAWLAGDSSILPAEAISYAQFGIIMSGLISIAAGLLIKLSGRKAVEKILPASSGPLAMIIGRLERHLSDAFKAWKHCVCVLNTSWVWVVSYHALSVIFQDISGLGALWAHCRRHACYMPSLEPYGYVQSISKEALEARSGRRASCGARSRYPRSLRRPSP